MAAVRFNCLFRLLPTVYNKAIMKIGQSSRVKDLLEALGGKRRDKSREQAETNKLWGSDTYFPLLNFRYCLELVEE